MIIRVKGGNSLGNQMFEYAFLKALEKDLGIDVLLDCSALEADKLNASIKQSVLSFNVKAKLAEPSDLKKVCKFRHNQRFGSFKYKVFLWLESKLNKYYFLEPDRSYIRPEKLLKYKYLDGYWQSYKYLENIRAELLEDFTIKGETGLKFREYRDKMRGENSVFVGFRRGDYLASKKNLNHYGTISNGYYLNGMKYIAERVENPVFYIFSNDVEWVRKNVSFDYDVRFMGADTGVSTLEEQQLMRSCKHAVIPNSTFHWWGAWLIENPGKIVVAPADWFVDGSPIDIVPPEWIQLDR